MGGLWQLQGGAGAHLTNLAALALLWPLEMMTWNQSLLFCVVSCLYMLHKPDASPAKRDKLKKLFSCVEILSKSHELSTIHKYLSVISGSKLKNRRRNNGMKEKITLLQPISVKRVNMSLLELWKRKVLAWSLLWHYLRLRSRVMNLLGYSLEKLLDCNLACCLRKIKLSSHQATSLYKLIGFNNNTSLHFYKTAWEMNAGNTKESSMGSQL